MPQPGGSTEKKRKYEKFTLSVKLRYKTKHPKEEITGTAKIFALHAKLTDGPYRVHEVQGHYL
jgi:hypothetical protein